MESHLRIIFFRMLALSLSFQLFGGVTYSFNSLQVFLFAWPKVYLYNVSLRMKKKVRFQYVIVTAHHVWFEVAFKLWMDRMKKKTEPNRFHSQCLSSRFKQTNGNESLFVYAHTHRQFWSGGLCVCVSLGMDFVVPIQMQCLNIDQIKANTLRNRIVCLSFPVWLNRHSYLTVASPSFTFAQRHSTLTTLHLDCADYGYGFIHLYIYIPYTILYIDCVPSFVNPV